MRRFMIGVVVLLVVAVLVVRASIAQANSILTVDQSNETAALGGYVITGGGFVGQGFTPTLTGLDAVELILNKQTSSDGSVLVQIRDNDITGTILGTSQSKLITGGSGYGSSYGIVHFDFPSTVALSPGRLHVIEVASVAGGNLGVFVTNWGTNPYSGGTAYHRGVSQPGEDLWFREGLTPKTTHLLVVGVRDQGDLYPGGGFDHRGDIGASNVSKAFVQYRGVQDPAVLTLNTQDTGNDLRLIARINEVKQKMQPGDTFVFYINSHGIFDESGTEPLISAETLSGRVPTTGDERLYLSRAAANERISDDRFTALFQDEKWNDVNKLFIIDTCYAGGFWGVPKGLDDLSRLPHTAILAASTEDLMSTAAQDESGFIWGCLGQSVVTALEHLKNEPNVSFQQLSDEVNLRGKVFDGSTGYIQGFEDGWPATQQITWLPYSAQTTDFSLDLPAVPEPSTFVLLGMGAIGLLGFAWRRKQTS